MTDHHQTNIFDLLEARTQRDRAVKQTGDATDPVWAKAAAFAVRAVSATHHEFTTDDVWAELAYLGFGAPVEPRAMGTVMTRARTLGLITPTDRVTTSARPECHARPNRVWRSLVCE